MWTVSGGNCGMCGEFFPRLANHNQARVCSDCAAFCLELLERSKSTSFLEHHCVSCERTTVTGAFKRLDNRHVCAPCVANAAHMLHVTASDGLISAHLAAQVPVETAPAVAMSKLLPKPELLRLPKPSAPARLLKTLTPASFELVQLFPLPQELAS
ncbi:MAG: hypothetical protein K1X64_20650 [Myxococcaceae bacterium]|nr:hypothetical protein [Myxococcaceae bacterium]